MRITWYVPYYSPAPDTLGCAPRLQHQIERISQLPRTKQRFVIEMLYTMRARASR